MSDKQAECGCHRECTVLPHDCEKPCRWPDCLTDAEHAELQRDLEMDWPGLVRQCSQGPHRGPQGPNEDVDQCPECRSMSWCLRPEGHTYGHHLPDCSLPLRHEGYCQPGGDGHPPARVIRGYWP